MLVSSSPMVGFAKTDQATSDVNTTLPQAVFSPHPDSTGQPPLQENNNPYSLVYYINEVKKYLLTLLPIINQALVTLSQQISELTQYLSQQN